MNIPETNYNIHIVKNSDHASNTYHISPVNQMINNYLPVSANTPDNYFNYNINSLEESNLFDDFSLELTAHENWYDQKQLAQPSYTPRFHKQNLSIFYNLSNYFSVGEEFEARISILIMKRVLISNINIYNSNLI